MAGSPGTVEIHIPFSGGSTEVPRQPFDVTIIVR